MGVVIMMKRVIFALVAMMALTFAACTRDAVVNSGSYSVITCAGAPPTAMCYMLFSNGNQTVVMPQDLSFDYLFAYPADAGGNVVATYKVDDRFEYGQAYNTTMQCANDTTSTALPVGIVTIDAPRSPSGIVMMSIWLKDNVNYMTGGLLFLFFIMVIMGLYWNTIKEVIGV